MEKDTPTPNNSPPDSMPMTGQAGQKSPEISVVQIQPKVIPKITITDSKEGITILYAKSPFTDEAVDKILRFIEDRSNRRFTYPASKPHISLLILLAGVHPAEEQSKEIVIENETLKRGNELVIQYIDKLNINNIQTISVKEAEVPVEPVSPLLGLHKELEKVGAYDKIKNEKHRQVLEAYLSSNISQRDLMQMAGVNEDKSVNNIIHRSLHKVFAELPSNIQREHGGSANEAIRLKAKEQIKTDLSRERIKKGVAGKERTYTKPRGRPKGVVEKQPRQYKEKTGRPKGRKDSQPRKTRKGSQLQEQQVSESQKHYPQEQQTHVQRPLHEEHTIADFSKSPHEH